MKKIKIAFIGLLMMGLGAGVVNAQDKAAAPAKKSSSTTQTDKKAPAASGQHLKKDGTPDKRYKENKTATGTTAKPAATKSTKKSTAAKTDKAAK